MTDDVENHTLRLLQEMRAEMREGFVETRAGMREGFARADQRLTAVEQRLTGVELHATGIEQRLGGLEGAVSKVIDAVTEIAKVQETHSAVLSELVESSRIAGGRLNALEARLGRIEKHAGLAVA